MERIYTKVIENHINENKQMLLLAGPRQVGKSTIGLSVKHLTDAFTYLNWDEFRDQELILSGTHAVAHQAKLSEVHEKKPIIVFDELHKYSRWKSYLKGFYDYYQSQAHIVVTGSAKLNIYQKGADSLMGRYFLYRIHPFSVAENLSTALSDQLLKMPKKIDETAFSALWTFGGFPEPYLKQNMRFYRRWRRDRTKQLFREDIRDLTQIQEFGQLELFAQLLRYQSANLVNMNNLATKMQVSVSTIKRWLYTLENFYYCFLIRPFSKNVARSLLKEPKLYLWDWSYVENDGARAENFVASHLLKAVHFWTDIGLGDFELYFLRDKEKREVDFLVTQDQKPWFLVEVKKSDSSVLSPSLEYFQKQLNAKHAFQVVLDMDYREVNCFEYSRPVIVPARTFLSQLI